MSLGLTLTILLTATGAVAAEVPLWGRFETTVVNARPYSNPFTAVTLSATFSSPSGRNIPFWGFFDGDGRGGQIGNVWKLRFMPDEPGEWTWRCSFSDSAPCQAGRFNCIRTSAKPGPLRVDPEHPRWFRFADGSRRHLHGYYYLDFWSDFDEEWRQRTRSIILEDGYTLIMPMSYIRGPGTEGAIGQQVLPTYAWATSGGKVIWDRFDLATWSRLDARLHWASDHNLVIYTFDGFFPNIGEKVPSDKEDLYIRYALARHAPFWNLLWTVGFETWEQYTPAQVKDWARGISNLDPWKHPVSWHDQGSGSVLTALQRAAWSHLDSAADYANLQWEFRSARSASDFVLANDHGKPVLAAECNWESLDGMYGKPRNREEVRRGIWGVALAGAIPIYADWTSGYDPDGGRVARHYGLGKGRADVNRLNRFLVGIPWWSMEPHPNLLWAGDGDDVCLAAPGRQYAVYSESGPRIKLSLTKGVYEGEWFNPVEGIEPASVKIPPFAWQGGTYSARSPSAADWVLSLRVSASQ